MLLTGLCKIVASALVIRKSQRSRQHSTGSSCLRVANWTEDVGLAHISITNCRSGDLPCECSSFAWLMMDWWSVWSLSKSQTKLIRWERVGDENGRKEKKKKQRRSEGDLTTGHFLHSLISNDYITSIDTTSTYHLWCQIVHFYILNTLLKYKSQPKPGYMQESPKIHLFTLYH